MVHLPLLSCCVRSLLSPHRPDSQLTHTHPVLGVLGAKGELFLRCEEVKGAPRQMEVTSRPQLCPGRCSGRPQPWGAGSFMRVEGQKAQGVIGGGCSPVLPRIQPHQLQIKGVDTVTLEDGVPGSPRAQPRRSPTALAQACSRHQPAATPLGVPWLLGPEGPALSLLPTSRVAPLSPFPSEGLAGTQEQLPLPPHPAPTWPQLGHHRPLLETSLRLLPPGGWRPHC